MKNGHEHPDAGAAAEIRDRLSAAESALTVATARAEDAAARAKAALKALRDAGCPGKTAAEILAAAEERIARSENEAREHEAAASKALDEAESILGAG